MRKAEVETLGAYWAEVSGQLTIVRIDGPCIYGGWWATNLKTGRYQGVRVKSARRLRCRAQADHVVQYKSQWGDKV